MKWKVKKYLHTFWCLNFINYFNICLNGTWINTHWTTLSNDIRGTGNSSQIKIGPIRLIVIHCGIYCITKNDICDGPFVILYTVYHITILYYFFSMLNCWETTLKVSQFIVMCEIYPKIFYWNHRLTNKGCDLNTKLLEIHYFFSTLQRLSIRYLYW